MEARVLDLARAGTEDAVVAALLTQEGFRSPRQHSQVLVNTIRAIRLRHRVLQAPSHPRRLPGWLTVSQLAQQLGIPRDAGSTNASAAAQSSSALIRP